MKIKTIDNKNITQDIAINQPFEFLYIPSSHAYGIPVAKSAEKM